MQSGSSLAARFASTRGFVQNVRSRTHPASYLNAPGALRILRSGAGIVSGMKRLPTSSVKSALRVRSDVNTAMEPFKNAQHVGKRVVELSVLELF